jgi:MATE family multidrug resistance protein
MQAYGAKNYKMLGLVMQRAVLVCWGACIPISLFLSNSKPSLLLMSLPQEVVDGASRYLLLMTPALFANAISCVLNRYA